MLLDTELLCSARCLANSRRVLCYNQSHLPVQCIKMDTLVHLHLKKITWILYCLFYNEKYTKPYLTEVHCISLTHRRYDFEIIKWDNFILFLFYVLVVLCKYVRHFFLYFKFGSTVTVIILGLFSNCFFYTFISENILYMEYIICLKSYLFRNPQTNLNIRAYNWYVIFSVSDKRADCMLNYTIYSRFKYIVEYYV